jgi:prepilin-type N-terminal cleavage/methylation domain-containing protein
MRARFVSRVRREDGFSLIEMLTALVVVGILMSAFASIVSAMVTHSTEITAESVAQTQARAGIDELARDLRQAYAGDGTSGIEAFTTSSITFDSPDRAAPFHLRRISYRVSGGVLQRQLTTSTNTNGPPWTWGTVGPWVERVTNVKNSTIFAGFSDFPTTSSGTAGTSTTTASSGRAVTITITVGAPGSLGKQYTYTGSAGLRSSAP